MSTVWCANIICSRGPRSEPLIHGRGTFVLAGWNWRSMILFSHYFGESCSFFFFFCFFELFHQNAYTSLGKTQNCLHRLSASATTPEENHNLTCGQWCINCNYLAPGNEYDGSHVARAAWIVWAFVAAKKRNLKQWPICVHWANKMNTAGGCMLSWPCLGNIRMVKLASSLEWTMPLARG